MVSKHASLPPATPSLLQSLSSPQLFFLSYLPSPPLPSPGGWRPIPLLWVKTNTWAREGCGSAQWTVTQVEGAPPRRVLLVELRPLDGQWLEPVARQLCASVSGGLVLLDHSLYSLHPSSLQSVRSLWPFGDLILSGSTSVDISFFLLKTQFTFYFSFDVVTFQVNRSPLKATPSVL